MAEALPSFKAVLFIQKPFTSDTEQMGCYYFNILSAVYLCRQLEAAMVPPLLPLCPRDNYRVEKQAHRDWASAILEISSIPSEQVLDYSNVASVSLDEFYSSSGGKARLPDKSNSLDVRGFRFTNDPDSEFVLLHLPQRWDINQHDPHVFFNESYPLLPLLESPLDLAPAWFREASKKPFLGVHWRRGDRGNAKLGQIGLHLWMSTEPAVVAKQINVYLESNPELAWVYVSTNSGSEEDRKTLQRLVKKPLYFFERPANIPPREHWRWDICDLLLAAQAQHLLLSPGGFTHSSAFGRLMIAQCYKNHPSDALISFIPLI
jgi:hypothetical protein